MELSIGLHVKCNGKRGFMNNYERRNNYGEGNGNPLQYSCLKIFTDRGAWWDTVHGVAKIQTLQ